MAIDLTAEGTASRLARCDDLLITRYLSGWGVTETAGSTAFVKIRDAISPPTSATAASNATAGSVDTGVHYVGATVMTRFGESAIGPLTEFTAVASKKADITVAVCAYNGPDIIGRNVYWSKAGVPATGSTPTRAQMFLVLVNPTTTLTSAMNSIPLPQTSLTVASTTGFAAAGKLSVATTFGTEVVTYTSVDATHFLGCTGGLGIMATSGAVTQPYVADNTTTSVANFNIADSAFTATNPPATDTGGRPLEQVKLSSGQSTGDSYFNPRALAGGAGVYVEVNSGTVAWEVSGQ